jgi:hypothetical protein
MKKLQILCLAPVKQEGEAETTKSKYSLAVQPKIPPLSPRPVRERMKVRVL